jgi:hypothetical protein
MDAAEALARLDSSDDRQEEGEVLRDEIERLREDLKVSQQAVRLLRRDARADPMPTGQAFLDRFYRPSLLSPGS